MKKFMILTAFVSLFPCVVYACDTKKQVTKPAVKPIQPVVAPVQIVQPVDRFNLIYK